MVRRMESNYSSQNNVRRGDTESPAANGATRHFYVKGVAAQIGAAFLFIFFVHAQSREIVLKQLL